MSPFKAHNHILVIPRWILPLCFVLKLSFVCNYFLFLSSFVKPGKRAPHSPVASLLRPISASPPNQHARVGAGVAQRVGVAQHSRSLGSSSSWWFWIALLLLDFDGQSIMSYIGQSRDLCWNYWPDIQNQTGQFSVSFQTIIVDLMVFVSCFRPFMASRFRLLRKWTTNDAMNIGKRRPTVPYSGTMCSEDL